MAELSVNVHSLRIETESGSLVLPNAAVAEIISYRDVSFLDAQTGWLKGKIEWRGLDVPLVDFDQMLERGQATPDKSYRIAILNTLNGADDLPFIGLIMKSIPHLVQANQANVSLAGEGDSSELVKCRVFAEGEPAEIPDIDALEEKVRASLAGELADSGEAGKDKQPGSAPENTSGKSRKKNASKKKSKSRKK